MDQVVDQTGKGVTPGIVLLYWYSYGSDGLPFFAFGVGQVLGDTMTVEMLFDYDGNGPFFGPDWSADQFSPVKFADLVIVWSGCNAGLMSMVIDAVWESQFEAHDLNLIRATAIEGLAC